MHDTPDTIPDVRSMRRARGRLLTLVQAEALSGIPDTTLRDLIARGILAEVRLPGVRRVWLDRQDLDRLIDRAREVRR